MEVSRRNEMQWFCIGLGPDGQGNAFFFGF